MPYNITMIRKITYTPCPQDAGRTVTQILRKHGISRHVINILKRYPDGITMGGKQVFANFRLPKDFAAYLPINLCLYEAEVSDILPQSGLPLHIVYEDDDLFVCNKPAGMAVHPSPMNRGNTLANALAHRYAVRGEVFVFRPIGRLDKNTSGLICLAKNGFSACMLTDMAQQKRLSRTYLALCTGNLPESGAIDAPIGRLDDSVIARTVRPDGDHALTRYRCLARYAVHSLAEITIQTGRTHQIRVHMAHIGHGLAGDFLYCPQDTSMDRHALHAWKLTLEQPITGKKLEFCAPLPEDMRKLLGEAQGCTPKVEDTTDFL